MLDEFEREMKQATLRVIEKALAQFGPGDIYGFSLYTSGEFQYVNATLFTETGLHTVTLSYFEKHDWFRQQSATLEEGKRELRWSPCDSPHHLFAEEALDMVNELLGNLWSPVLALRDPYIDDGPFINACRDVEICMLRTLIHLRQSAILPTSVVLCLMMGDQSYEDRLAYAEVLNPPATLSLFRSQLESLDGWSINEPRLEEARRGMPDKNSLMR